MGSGILHQNLQCRPGGSSLYVERAEQNLAPEAILEALENEHDRRILALAQTDPVDAQAIMESTGMAKSTVYRRLHTLQRQGLLAVERSALRDGHPVELYRSRLDMIRVQIQGGNLEVRWQQRDDDADQP